MITMEFVIGVIGFAVGLMFALLLAGGDMDSPLDFVFMIVLPTGFFWIHYMLAKCLFISSARDTFNISNVEERVKKMQKLGVEKMLKAVKAQPLNVSLRGNSLYVIDSLIPNYELKYLVYKDPSSPDKMYGCFVPSKFNTADEAMSWKFYITEAEYSEDLKFEA